MADFKAFSPSSWKAFTKKCSELFPFLKKTFTGTMAEWEALTTTEKSNYDIVNLTDDTSDIDSSVMSATVTESAYIDNGSIHYVKYGRVVTVTGYVHCNGTYPAGASTVVSTGLPTPMSSDIVVFATESTTIGSQAPIMELEGDSLSLYAQTAGEFGNIRFSGSYICA